MHSTEQLRIVIAGHVDHGKSTFIGRLFHDTGSLPEGKFEQIQAACERRGVPFEWAFLTDGLQAERDQNVTIDTGHIWFRTPRRRCVLIDAPGHKEFLKNMVTGAAGAEAALLLIDAVEGVREQTRQHEQLLQLLGIKQVVVLVNKMDRCGFRVDVFRRLAAGYPGKLVIPICAKTGDNIAAKSANMPWYDGPTALEALDGFESPEPPANLPLRLPVQDIYRFDNRRIVAGRIESGALRVGDRILFSPRHKLGTVQSLEGRQSVGITLAEQIFVERGQIISHEHDAPLVADVFSAKLFWLGKQKLDIGRRLKLKLVTQEIECHIESLSNITDDGAFADVAIRTKRPIAFDTHDRVAATGRFVLVDQHRVCGGGIITKGESIERSQNVFWTETEVSRADRERRNKHKGTVVWLTGLSASGKSTIASALERELFALGMHTYVLDGDNIRHGLSANLGFRPDDRTENIRRVGEVAKLFCDAGIIVVVAFISPYRDDRRLARSLVDEGDFVEVHVNASLAACERRDKKGLYRKARAGEIANFTGVSAPYEPPEHAEIVLDTERHTPAECVEQILRHLQDNGRI
ncbi:MAG: adenylyl-sulfate kinase [Verrucomicrobia bacterium]|nr:adenylyl-sulfate kinase [Verrucomicrobiota bacterium]